MKEKTEFAKTAVPAAACFSEPPPSERTLLSLKFISILNRSIPLLCKANYIVTVEWRGRGGKKKKAAFVLSSGEIRKCVSMQMTLIERVGKVACRAGEKADLYLNGLLRE